MTISSTKARRVFTQREVARFKARNNWTVISPVVCQPLLFQTKRRATPAPSAPSLSPRKPDTEDRLRPPWNVFTRKNFSLCFFLEYIQFEFFKFFNFELPVRNSHRWFNSIKRHFILHFYSILTRRNFFKKSEKDFSFLFKQFELKINQISSFFVVDARFNLFERKF